MPSGRYSQPEMVGLEDRLALTLLSVATAALRSSAIGAVLLAAVIAGAFCWLDALGRTPVDNAVAFVLTIGAWAVLTRVTVAVYQARPRTTADAGKWTAITVVLFILNGATWGSAAWYMWVPDSTLNHFALMVLCILSMGNAGNEHGESLLFVVAIMLGNATVTGLSFLAHPSDIGMAPAVLIPVAIVWYTIIANNSRRRFQELVVTRFRNEDLVNSFSVARDEALALKARAESASSAKSTFLANMSHELRTPLNAIIGFAQIVRDELFGPLNNDRYKDYVGDIESSGQHLLGIINDILDIAKIEAGKMELVQDLIDPCDFIEDAVRVSQGQHAPSEVGIDLHFGHNDHHVLGDGRMLRQSVINLLSNATKHSPEGQAVEIRTSLTEGGDVRICVADKGPGLPQHLVERVFNAFEQADNSYTREKQGTGLGLALVRAFISAHGGRVWLESEPGRGATAIIELPAAPDDADRIAA